MGAGAGDPEARAVGRVTAVRCAAVLGPLLSFEAAAAAVRIGGLVAMPTAAEGRSYGLVHALREGRRSDDAATIEVHLSGELADAGDARRFRRDVSACPPLGAGIRRAARAQAALVYAEPEAPHVRVGSLRHDPRLPAHLVTDALLGRHFAILGRTGLGKFCAVTVLLQAVLDAHPCAHVLLIDPHGECAAAFGERALRLDPSSLELPHWLLTFEGIAAILTSGGGERAYAKGVILREAILRAKRLHAGDRDGTAGHLTADTPVPYRLSDLARAIEDGMGALNKPEGTAAYRHLLARVASAREDPRYAFMFQSLYVRDNLDAILGRLLRIPVAGRAITLLDISGVPSEVVNVVVSVLCRLLFEFSPTHPSAQPARPRRPRRTAVRIGRTPASSKPGIALPPAAPDLAARGSNARTKRAATCFSPPARRRGGAASRRCARACPGLVARWRRPSGTT